MKNTCLLVFFTLFLSSCQTNTMMPDTLGQELFAVFKSNKTNDLKKLYLTVDDEIRAIENSEKDLLFNAKMKKELYKRENDKNYKLEINKKRFEIILEDFNAARENLLDKITANITDYKVTEIYGYLEAYDSTFNTDITRAGGYIILEIKNDSEDVHYIEFETDEIIENDWKISGEIRISNSLSEEFIKYGDINF